MFNYSRIKKSEKGKSESEYDNHFWDKLVRVLFITGVVIILLTIAIKWLGFLD